MKLKKKKILPNEERQLLLQKQWQRNSSSTMKNHVDMVSPKENYNSQKKKKLKIIEYCYFSQFSSVTQSCLTLCNSMNHSTPGLLIHHQLLSLPKPMSIELVMTSNHLILCHPPTFNHSQHQGLFVWVSFLHQVAKVLKLQLQHQSFKWLFRTDFLQDWLVWSPCSTRDSQESSPTPQFKSINSSMLKLLYSLTLTSIHDYWKNQSFDKMDLCQQSKVSF